MRDSKEFKVNIVAHIGVGGQKGYIYNVTGICPCLPATQYKDPCKVILSALETSTKVAKDNLDIHIQKTD